jgi:hypothetical protein
MSKQGSNTKVARNWIPGYFIFDIVVNGRTIIYDLYQKSLKWNL